MFYSFYANGVAYTSYDAVRDYWISFVGCRLVNAPELSWDQFVDAFLERFMPFSLRDRMWDGFDHLEQGSMIIF